MLLLGKVLISQTDVKMDFSKHQQILEANVTQFEVEQKTDSTTGQSIPKSLPLTRTRSNLNEKVVEISLNKRKKKTNS